MRIDIGIQGLDELNRKFASLTRSLNADAVEPLVYEAADIITQEMRRRVPVGPTSNLKDALRTVRLRREGGRPAPSIAAVDRMKAPHAHLVEFGTSTRRVKKKKVLYDKRTGKFFGTEVEEMPAKPFVRQSLQAKQGEAVAHVVSGIEKLIEEGAK